MSAWSLYLRQATRVYRERVFFEPVLNTQSPHGHSILRCYQRLHPDICMSTPVQIHSDWKVRQQRIIFQRVLFLFLLLILHVIHDRLSNRKKITMNFCLGPFSETGGNKFCVKYSFVFSRCNQHKNYSHLLLMSNEAGKYWTSLHYRKVPRRIKDDQLLNY